MWGRFLTKTISTKRSPIITGGKRGVPVTYLTGVLCTPFDPVDPEVRLREQIDTAHELLQTFVLGDADIVEGDTIVTSSGTEYPVKAVGQWDWRTTKYLHLYIEDLKV